MKCKELNASPSSSGNEFVTSWRVEIHGLEESEIPLLEEKIPTFHRKSMTVLSAELLKEDPDTLDYFPQFHPAMGRVTKILNRLDGIGYKVISSTNITNHDQRQCIIWTLVK